MPVMISHLNRKIAAAKRYAAADHSDPFAFRRAMCHINQGIVGFMQNGEEAFYNAVAAFEERRLPDGRSYQATVYRNITRP